jgi:hypothetical protein
MPPRDRSSRARRIATQRTGVGRRAEPLRFVPRGRKARLISTQEHRQPVALGLGGSGATTAWPVIRALKLRRGGPPSHRGERTISGSPFRNAVLHAAKEGGRVVGELPVAEDRTPLDLERLPATSDAARHSRRRARFVAFGGSFLMRTVTVHANIASTALPNHSRPGR